MSDLVEPGPMPVTWVTWANAWGVVLGSERPRGEEGPLGGGYRPHSLDSGGNRRGGGVSSGWEGGGVGSRGGGGVRRWHRGDWMNGGRGDNERHLEGGWTGHGEGGKNCAYGLVGDEGAGGVSPLGSDLRGSAGHGRTTHPRSPLSTSHWFGNP